MDHILVTGIKALGIHGVLPEERERPQPIEVDLDIQMDLSAAGTSDALSDTVDYGALALSVQAIVILESHRLLESLATRIAAVCRTDPRVVKVEVTVRKLRPAIGAMVRHVGIRIER